MGDAEADADAEAYWFGNYYNGAYAYNTYPVAAQVAAPAVVEPVVKAVETVVPTVAAPLLKAAPAIAPIAAPLPLARAPIVKPVVAEVAKKVTYTHLGAHPLVNPATIIEKEAQVIGHEVY